MMNSQAAKASPRCALVTADEHDLVGGLERPDAMDDEGIGDVPARFRFVDDGGERLFRHARIVLERHARNGSVGIDVAHGADERGDRTDRAIAVAQRGELAAGVEIFSLDSHWHAHCKRPDSTARDRRKQRNLVARAIGVSASARSWLTATRTARPGASSVAHAPPRARKPCAQRADRGSPPAEARRAPTTAPKASRRRAR